MEDDADFFGDLLKRITPYLLITVAGGTFVATIASVITLNALLGWNFDSIHKRIDDSNTGISKKLVSFEKKLNTAVNSLNDTKTITKDLSTRLEQLDADIQFIREFTTEVSRFEETILYGPELIPVGFGNEPIGGPGTITSWPTYTLELSFPTSDDDIEDAEQRARSLLERALISSREYEYNPELHEIKVFKNIRFPRNGNPILEVKAVSFNRD
ncbi:MAG: hypothetical protein AAFQ87_18630 [Bacteroidota bacterium]